MHANASELVVSSKRREWRTTRGPAEGLPPRQLATWFIVITSPIGPFNPFTFCSLISRVGQRPKRVQSEFLLLRICITIKRINRKLWSRPDANRLEIALVLATVETDPFVARQCKRRFCQCFFSIFDPRTAIAIDFEYEQGISMVAQ